MTFFVWLCNISWIEAREVVKWFDKCRLSLPWVELGITVYISSSHMILRSFLPPFYVYEKTHDFAMKKRPLGQPLAVLFTYGCFISHDCYSFKGCSIRIMFLINETYKIVHLNIYWKEFIFLMMKGYFD